MHRIRPLVLCALLACATALAAPAWAHDVDGPDDCQRALRDFGDAPENIPAYPAVIGHFPTCVSPGQPGTQEFKCGPLSTVPGLTGYVVHNTPVTGIHYWLGCGGAAAPMGIDAEGDGKVNLTGAGNPSACSASTLADCTEPAFGMTFGQDECYGDDDAGLAAPPVLTTCSSSTIAFRAYSCSAVAIQVYLNVLIDLNHDGDWNDNVYCNLPGGCAHEWAVRNVVIALQPGCNNLTTPAFLVGSNAVESWMRITISDQPVNDDFPWAGSVTMPGGDLRGGETEDYPLTIHPVVQNCPIGYRDFGDAPEGFSATPTFFGNYPTCTAGVAPAGGQEIECGTAQSIAPPAGATAGFVEHIVTPTSANHFWFGCGPEPAFGVDDESDGKSSAGVSLSRCGEIPVDCIEPAFGMQFGQDECYGDGDAGLVAPVAFRACSTAVLRYKAYACDHEQIGYLNVLVDWSQDGDWNDNLICGPVGAGGRCATEWVVKNVRVILRPGCGDYDTPRFRVGSRAGSTWMRMTLTAEPVPEDFPWNGSLSTPNHSFNAGETEDYPVRIYSPTTNVGALTPSDGTWFAVPAPNPGVHATLLRFGLASEAKVSLAVYDLFGRRITRLADGTYGAGSHSIEWDYRTADGARIPPGLYVMKLVVADRTFTQRAIVGR